MPPTPDPQLTAADARAILDSSSDCIKVLDLDAHLLSMNAGGLKVMDMDDFSVCQNALWPTFWQGQDRQQVEQSLDAARAGRSTTFEGQANTFAGTPKWWEVRVSPLRADDGQVTRLLAVSRDITAHKVVEQQLREAQHLLHDHAQRLEVRVSQQNRALDAFVRFTTRVATTTDLRELATAAGDIVQDAVDGSMSGFYLVRGDRAYPVVFSSNTPPEAITARQGGVSLHTPVMRAALTNRETAFSDGAAGREQATGFANALSVTAYFLHDQPYALFRSGTLRSDWTAQERAIIASVGQGLGLALERVHQTQQLERRTAGLDAFVAFSEASGTISDILVLAQQAVIMLETTLQDVSIAYYELDGDLWKARVWSAAIGPDIVTVLTSGIPTTAPSYAEAINGRKPVFVPGWFSADEGVAHTEAFGAGAFYPCFVGDAPRGLLAMGTQRAGDWTPREEAVFSAVGRSLTLALERAAQTQELTAQRDALNRQTQNLVAANEELEAFTYSASHDLRTPIRHVMGFADLALAALSKNDFERVQRHLGIVQQGARRMEALVDGMLMLSRAGRQDVRPRWMPLDAIITQAVQEVQLAYPTQSIEAREPSPVQVWGDPTLIQQVMTNLINNAVKYSITRSVSELDIQVQESVSEWIITVRDNGVGFDAAYAGKLFGIFQRLHTQSAFPGVGIGLATVRRIVLKHGGRVFAVSEGGDGATFGVALPRPQGGVPH